MTETESRHRFGVGTDARVECWSYTDGQRSIAYVLVEGNFNNHVEPATSVLYSRMDSDMVWKRCGVRREDVAPEIVAMLNVFWYLTD